MTAQAGIWTIVFVNPEDDSESVLGQFAIGQGDEISVVSAEGPCEPFLTEVADSLNEKSSLNVKTPGTTRYAVSSQIYVRGAENFLEGVRAYLRHYYSLELRSSRDFVGRPEEFEGLLS